MEEKFNISSLFNISGNLTLSAMERYLEGRLTAEEKSIVEKHLATSPFDREALEGIRKHQIHDIPNSVATLQTKIGVAMTDKAAAPIMRSYRRYYWAAAAGIVGLAGLAVLMVFMFRVPDSLQTAVVNQEPETSRQSSVDSQQSVIGGIAMVNQDVLSASQSPSVKEVPIKVIQPPAKPPEPVYTIDADMASKPEKQVAVVENVAEPVREAIAAPPVTSVDDNATVAEEMIAYDAEEKAIDQQENVTLEEVAVTRKRTGSARKNKETEYEAMGIRTGKTPEEDTIVKESQIFTVVETMPEFPGGDSALYRYLGEKIHYPDSARANGIQGRVFVTFVIEKDGSVSDVRILRGIGGGCDEEALRVIQNMPKWIPGKQRGKPVRVQYNLPIKFSL